MKAIHSEEYYRLHWNEYMAQTELNLAAELTRRTKVLSDVLTGDELMKAIGVYAKKIADEAEAELKKPWQRSTLLMLVTLLWVIQQTDRNLQKDQR